HFSLRPRCELFPYTTLFRSVDGRVKILKNHGSAPVTRKLEKISQFKSYSVHFGILCPNGQNVPMWQPWLRMLSSIFVSRICPMGDRKSTRLNSSHVKISYAV